MSRNDVIKPRPIIVVAAESIASRSGGSETVVDVIQGRALRQFAASIRSYLALRLGSVTEASLALKEVRSLAAAADAQELVRAPGVKARLYRLARDVARQRLGETLSSGRRLAGLPFVLGDEHTLYHALRTGLDGDTLELLELRHVRHLQPDEIAHILGRDVSEDLQRAVQVARAVLGESHANLEISLREALEVSFPPVSVSAEEADDWAPLATGTLIANRYEIEVRVGSGACADVYRAKDTRVRGHIVALKLLHQPATSENSREAALRELHLIASVFHPSVVQFKDHGWFESRLWFVMPWYNGETLEERIRREPLTRTEARKIFQPLARALATMHAAGIRHQDVKPSNILLARIAGYAGGHAEEILPVLLDLGVAAKDAEMVVAGTPTYFAPEVAAQFASDEPPSLVTTKADVFSLALSLRNALEPATEELVTDGDVEKFIERRAKGYGHFPETPELAFLEPFFMRCLHAEPAHRPTADELADALTILTRPEERRSRLRAAARWALPVAAGIGMAFGTTVFSLRNDADAAREDASAAQASLSVARQAQEKLRQSYESSQLTRQELVAKLASAESTVAVGQHEIAERRAQIEQLRQTAAQARAESSRLDAELGRERVTLGNERERSEQLVGQLQSVRGELGRLDRETSSLRTTVADLTGQNGTLRTRLDAERAKSEVLERQLLTAEAAKSRIESELLEARRAHERPRIDDEPPAEVPPEPETADTAPLDSDGPV